MTLENALSAQQILDILPHRYPFLLIDRVLEVIPLVKVVAIKNVTFNEPYFQGHFPGMPVMPGVLQLEALAQTSAVLAYISIPEEMENKTFMICAANDIKWKRQVVPGDTLHMEMRLVKRRKPFVIMEGSATVDGQLCCSATITAAQVG